MAKILQRCGFAVEVGLNRRSNNLFLMCMTFHSHISLPFSFHSSFFPHLDKLLPDPIVNCNSEHMGKLRLSSYASDIQDLMSLHKTFLPICFPWKEICDHISSATRLFHDMSRIELKQVIVHHTCFHFSVL